MRDDDDDDDDDDVGRGRCADHRVERVRDEACVSEREVWRERAERCGGCVGGACMDEIVMRSCVCVCVLVRVRARCWIAMV